MKNKNKITKESLEMDMQTYKKVKGTLDPKANIKITGDKPAVSTMGTVTEEDAVIEPQDQATIKYLSNVKDQETGEISKPFTIGGKNYQMVRGTLPSKEIVMAVFCHDDLNEGGENIIHPVDHFEENIVKPFMQSSNMQSSVGSEPKEESYEGYKHYLVNKQTNEIRKFKNIKEMLSGGKLDEEDYMGVSEFKKHMNEKMFGGRKRPEQINEVIPTGEENDEEMNIKAKKLMNLISKKIPSNVITTITTPVAQREVIAAFAEMIGVPRTNLTSLIGSLKDIAKQPEQPIAEGKIITKKDLIERIKTKNIE